MKTAFITCLGKPIALYEFGEVSHPALLLIHGNSIHSSFLIPMIRLLEPKYHIISLDLPGHNHSGTWEKEDFCRENLALLFNSVLDFFKIIEAGACGFSMGGFILLESFDLVPVIRKLAMAGNPPFRSTEDIPEAYYLNEDSALFLKGPLNEDEVERIYTNVIRLKDDYLKVEIKESIHNTSPAFREGCLLMAQNTGNQVARLNQRGNPVTIIHAELDKAIRLDYLEKLQLNNLWENKIQIIHDCGHIIQSEKPLELASVLDRFFAGN